MTRSRWNSREFKPALATIDRRRWGRLPVSALGALLVTFIAGCPGSSSTPTGGGTTAASKQQENDDRCAEIVSSIRDTFDLQRLGQTTAISDGMMRINDWQQSCAPAVDISADWPEELQKLLPPHQREALASRRFTLRDGEHLRDCVLFRSLAGYAAGAATADASELQRVTAAFGHVVRAVELIPGHPDDLPLTPYEVYLVGKGTVADRAWIFAELLRQLKIDAVIVAPGAEGDGESP
ncbi:MAG TPA: hypothetical protein VL475_08850, partial [Planctomycetaceae bacterium]|nr:hypothetical protein [Planctomycetaceae bacterium]